ncbi:MAG TPA: hypothetical protein VJ782_08745, partial [Aeromicrobium sp.]|nr:hypothetical protein [Aeromicrobium sp.]
FPVIAGQAGTIARVRLDMTTNVRFVTAVFALPIAAKRLQHLIGNPLTEAGTERWNKPWVDNALKARAMVHAVGTNDEACGYSPGNQPGGDPVTGLHDNAASFGYHTFEFPVLYVAVYVPSATTLRAGRILFAQTEGGS